MSNLIDFEVGRLRHLIHQTIKDKNLLEDYKIIYLDSTDSNFFSVQTSNWYYGVNFRRHRTEERTIQNFIKDVAISKLLLANKEQ